MGRKMKPIQENERYIRWSAALQEDLKLRIRATGYSPKKLLERQKDVLGGLAYEDIRGWLSKKSGRVRKDHYQYVLHICLRGSKPQYEKRIHKKYTKITPEYLEKLNAEIKRTKVTPGRLPAGSSREKGALARTINRWRAGEAQSAPKETLDRALALYARLPDAREATPMKRHTPYVDLTPEYLSRLREEIERTKTGPGMLLKMFGKEKEIGENIVKNWLSGNTKKAEPQKMDLVLKLYAKLSTKQAGVITNERLFSTLNPSRIR